MDYDLQNQKKQVDPLTKEQRATMVKVEQEYGAFDYIKTIERVPGSPVLFIRKSRQRLFRRFPEPPTPDPEPKLKAVTDNDSESLQDWTQHFRPPGKRGAIVTFSRKAWLRMVEHAIRFPHKMRGFVTVTYHLDWPPDSKACKQHLKKLLRWMLDEQNVSHYFWALEFQDRGAPHYHVWTDIIVPETPLTEIWREITGDMTITRCESQPLLKSIAHYIAKEATKRYQKEAPEDWPPGRMWGHSRAKLLPLEQVPIPKGLTAHCMSIFFSPPLAFGVQAIDQERDGGHGISKRLPPNKPHRDGKA